MARAKCPDCGERVKASAGAPRVRCPQCGKWFSTDEDEDPRPRSKRKRRMSGTKITALIVSSLLVFALVGLVVVLIARKGGRDGSPASDIARVTLDNFNMVKPGMDVTDVEAVLGGGRPSSEEDMREAFRKALGDVAAGFEAGWARASEGSEWRRWDGQNLRVWVLFARTKEGLRAAFSTSLEQTPNGQKRYEGFATLRGNHDLDEHHAKRKHEDAVRNDPKWVRGGQARELLVGEWRDSLANGYTFALGGRMKAFSAFGSPFDVPPSYRILDDRFLEITPSTVRPPPGFPGPVHGQGVRRFEYLVNSGELALIDAMPQPVYPVRAYYRMPATAGSVAEAKIVAPLLGEVRSPDANQRRLGLARLRQLGRGAPTAVPALRELARETREIGTRHEIEATIRAIEFGQ